MTDLRKAAEMALDAMERRNAVNDEYKVYLQDAIEALRQALAQGEQGCAECGVKASEGYALYCVKCTELFTQPEQEPVGWFDWDAKQELWVQVYPNTHGQPLYAAPVSKPWVSLTDEEIMEPWPFETRIELVRWIEAKLREKNK